LRALLLTLCTLLGAGAGAARAQPAPDGGSPDGARREALVRIVRQDCGSCHGMRLTGGLGPALTRDALADKPLDSMAAAIFHGRPGTPMPGWRTMLSEADALWIAQQLLAGFPEEAKAAAR
jgi:cytochrome c55X